MRPPKHVEPTPFHPLTGLSAHALSRRGVLLGTGALIAAKLAGSSAVSAQGGVATPELQVEGEPEAVAMLERAAEALAALDSFAFEMTTARGSSTILSGFELKSVSGVVRRPTDLQADVEISIPLGNLTVSAISLDGVFYIQDPLSDGSWMELGEMGEIQTLVNPDVLILNAVRQVQDARIASTAKVDGRNASIVEGTVDFSGLLDQFGEGQEQMQSLLADDPVQVGFWIDDADRIVEVEMFGPIFASESDDVVRILTLSDFNEDVEIEAPEVVSTPTF
jgi:hypothetical protein